jgi:hypothetical protein
MRHSRCSAHLPFVPLRPLGEQFAQTRELAPDVVGLDVETQTWPRPMT